MYLGDQFPHELVSGSSGTDAVLPDSCRLNANSYLRCSARGNNAATSPKLCTLVLTFGPLDTIVSGKPASMCRTSWRERPGSASRAGPPHRAPPRLPSRQTGAGYLNRPGAGRRLVGAVGGCLKELCNSCCDRANVNLKTKALDLVLVGGGL